MKSVSAECEDLGYDSVWLTDHLLMPEGSGTPYERIFESVTTAAFIASVTRKARVGISVLVVPMRNPILVAKQLATIDSLSGGRLVLGVGAGWNEREFRNLGANFHNRGERLDDSIKLIRALWSGERSFASNRLSLRFKDASFEPNPVQKRLPIWVGGVSKAAMNRALELGDAWHPSAYSLYKIKKFIAQFKGLPNSDSFPICLRIGLDARSDSIHGAFRGTKTLQFCGDTSKNTSLMEELESLGVSYLLLTPDTDGTTPVRDQIQSLQIFAGKFLGN
jgi:probable F420-dependent oxidoreductase